MYIDYANDDAEADEDGAAAAAADDDDDDDDDDDGMIANGQFSIDTTNTDKAHIVRSHTSRTIFKPVSLTKPTTSSENICFETKARFPFKRNRLRCVRCVNENRTKRNQSWLPLLRPSIPIGWRLRLLREKRKRLRLNGNRALDCTVRTYLLTYLLTNERIHTTRTRPML